MAAGSDLQGTLSGEATRPAASAPSEGRGAAIVGSGACALAAALAAGELDALEVTEAFLERIAAVDASVEAWAHLDPEHARAQARLADEARRAGRPLGRLHGVPVGVKDIFDTADHPTEDGSPLHAGRTPGADAAVVERLRAAGAVVLGKTVTTEFAMYAPGKTRNPHDPARTPGGSSSGSAAAVAAWMAPLAVGSQTNGSTVRPAAFCGVYGFKPTHGLISRHGALQLSRTLDHVGLFARSVEDLALLGECLVGHDPRDPDTRPRPAPPLVRISSEPPPVTPALAFVRTPLWPRTQADTREAFDELVAHLGEAVEEVALPPAFEHALEWHRTIFEPDMARSLEREYRHGAQRLSPTAREAIERGRGVSAVSYTEACSQIGLLNALLERIFERYDAIVTPAAAGEAPTLETTGDPAFCTTWTLCGVPALSLPLMTGPAGLPLGVQLVGARDDDARLLRTARWLVATVTEGDS